MWLWFDVTRLAAAFDVVVLLTMVIVWGRNYRELHSKHTLGRLIFGSLMLAENGLALFLHD